MVEQEDPKHILSRTPQDYGANKFVNGMKIGRKKTSTANCKEKTTSKRVEVAEMCFRTNPPHETNPKWEGIINREKPTGGTLGIGDPHWKDESLKRWAFKMSRTYLWEGHRVIGN